MDKFTSKSESRGVSLPADMWAYVRERASREGRSLSNFIQRLIENDARDAAEAKVIADVPPRHRQTAEEFIVGKVTS